LRKKSAQTPALEILDNLIAPAGVIDRIWEALPDTPATALALNEIGQHLERLRHCLAA
jgi:hypothetical protein